MAFSHLSKYRRGLSTRETERVNEAGLRESMEEDMVGKEGLWEKGRERAFLLNPGGEREKQRKELVADWQEERQTEMGC
jgi:hypothetical protein